MLKLAVSFTALMLVASPLLAATPTIPECAKGIFRAIEELAATDFKENRPGSVSIVAFNDVGCNREEIMLNAVVVATWSDGKTAFIISHIHFYAHGNKDKYPEGKLKSSAEFFWWRKMENPNDWRMPWCNILTTIGGGYKEDAKREGC